MRTVTITKPVLFVVQLNKDKQARDISFETNEISLFIVYVKHYFTKTVKMYEEIGKDERKRI